MKLIKTDKETLSNEDILTYIANYERDVVPTLNKLWAYYEAENVTITNKPKPDANSPDNRIIIAYGRKLVTTWTGYGWRPRYITYKATKETDQSEIEDNEEELDEDGHIIEIEPKEILLTPDELYIKELQKTFNLNNEHIKTSRAGRNIGIFGMSYELVYIDKVYNTEESMMKAEPKFFTVDPREMILLYDYESEPQKKMAIRFYKVSENKYKVEVYYKDRVELFDRVKQDVNSKWELKPVEGGSYPNFFGRVPVVAFYAGDEMLGVIKPVLSLIDANDALYSDSMNEFDRFAFAYLIMKEYGITNPIDMKTPGKMEEVLRNLKKKRVFEKVPKDGEIKFLLKDIPAEFISFMADHIREQIHIQSHVPDFIKMATGALSGAAIQRLMFDFENLVSSTEADFDVGLLERIELITIIYDKQKRPVGTKDMITISHKRNVPLNLKELADTALVMKNAGFSSYLICDIMPDDIIPDVQAELRRQKKESKSLMMNNIDNGLADLGEESMNNERDMEENMDINNE